MLILFFGILLMLIMLIVNSRAALSLASLGLTLWFENMVPTLLPFMILSGILTGLKLQDYLTRPFQKAFMFLFHTTENGAYCMIMGFLCGFPMGAFCCADLHQKKLLSGREAARLIPVCNNIGPVYFYAFAIPLLQLQAPALRVYPLLTFGMYGIPLLFGIAGGMRERRPRDPVSCADLDPDKNGIRRHFARPDTAALFEAADDAVCNAGRSILRLCGYMILFNVLTLPVYVFCHDTPLCVSAHSIVEISGGIRMLGGYLQTSGANALRIRLTMLTALSFGGLCCCGQSYGFFREAGLRPFAYLLKRALMALLSGVFYWCCFQGGLLY